MYLFDTDILSSIIKKSPPLSLIKRLSSIPPEHQFTTAITVGELVYGAYKSHNPAYFIKKLESTLWPNIQILTFDKAAAVIYGKLRSELEKSGRPLSEPDMRIASIALLHNLILITGNIRHFSKIKNLKVENWLK
jgi:predicted nucleic acid-binding protein